MGEMLIVLLLLTSCATGYIGPTDRPEFAGATLISRGDGGLLRETRKNMMVSDAAGIEKVVDGTCKSACTLVIQSPHTCWTSKARFLFHGASQKVNKWSKKNWTRDNEAGTATLIALLPDVDLPRTMSRFDWIEISGEEMTEMTGRELCVALPTKVQE